MADRCREPYPVPVNAVYRLGVEGTTWPPDVTIRMTYRDRDVGYEMDVTFIVDVPNERLERVSDIRVRGVFDRERLPWSGIESRVLDHWASSSVRRVVDRDRVLRRLPLQLKSRRGSRKYRPAKDVLETLVELERAAHDKLGAKDPVPFAAVKLGKDPRTVERRRDDGQRRGWWEGNRLTTKGHEAAAREGLS